MDEIVAFLRGIGIEVEMTRLPDTTFLPGLDLDGERLLVDPEKLLYPGDLLHEAGHIAVTRPGQADADMGELEIAATLWSYAATQAIGIDPAIVFHEGGYRGKSPGLLSTFGHGVYPGLPYLEAAEMAYGPRRAAELGVPPFPHMVRWVRCAKLQSEDGSG